MEQIVIYLKVNDSEIVATLLCSEQIWKDLTGDNIEKQN